jgi:hypothetical protein
MKKLLLTVAAAWMLSGVEVRAQFNVPGYGFGGYWSNGFTAGTVVPPVNLQDRVPYFSLYPPVYYSYPVPRPYGHSPFAYPGWTPTPHVEAVEPQTVVNPYIYTAPAAPVEPKSPNDAPPLRPSSQKQAAATRTKKTGPLRIVNPYVGDIVAGGAK